jgi:hypothetical protein
MIKNRYHGGRERRRVTRSYRNPTPEMRQSGCPHITRGWAPGGAVQMELYHGAYVNGNLTGESRQRRKKRRGSHRHSPNSYVQYIRWRPSNHRYSKSQWHSPYETPERYRWKFIEEKGFKHRPVPLRYVKRNGINQMGQIVFYPSFGLTVYRR